MTDRILGVESRPWLTIRSAVVLALVVALALFTLVVARFHLEVDPGAFGGLKVKPLYAVAGLLVGVLVGLTGVGGGSLMTPLLVLLFGFHPATAVGTDLLQASATKSVGTVVHGANRTIDWRITGRMAIGSIPATLATVALLYVLHLHGEAASKLISSVLGFALLATAVTLLFRRHLYDFAASRAFVPGPRTALVLTVALGAVLGAMITLSSVGAGAIGVTVLIFLYPKMPVARIVGSDIAHAVPLTLIGGIGHWLLGSVNVPLLISLLAGSIPGIIVGSSLTPRIPERYLRPILAATLMLVGAKLAF